ncbi:ABC transporter permease [Olivibacter sp. SDN3]|uniref:ABC transporter permease n=1 Tax=Olivibacter sp. SDN3 TaxID=2764720 RepID=UPI0016516921|nr:ABC transporter permease [Olivibacter sp. SDN3]QNL50948.1 ABC transporter permease [Olivibacter sp. SDN3]
MFKNYLKIAWRNLLKQKKSSAINIIGLALGMAVFILIALWVWDELTFNRFHENDDRVGQIVQNQTWNGQTGTSLAQPVPLGNELRTTYGEYFKYVAMASWMIPQVLSYDDKHLYQNGVFTEKDGPHILSLKMLRGNRNALQDPKSIMLSESTAKAFFGDTDPIDKPMKIKKSLDVKVAAVYEDLPYNTSFRELDFIAPWELYLISEPWIKQVETAWDDNSFQTFVQISDHTNFETVNKAIVNAKFNRVSAADKRFKAQIIVHPMQDWHLWNDWKDGKVVGGLISYVKLFALIGFFVLLLACINFMNLSTARSEKRAKEVGVRKTVGSSKKSLVYQFLTESILVSVIGFGFSILLVVLSLPWFNEISNKQIVFPWNSLMFWAIATLITGTTGIVAGSYPAFYLSSFKPLKVLKGTFKVGRLSTLPRKILVTVQFSISIALIIGTIIVYKQIHYTKDRPIGYDRGGLVTIRMATADFYGKYDVLREKLKNLRAIEELSESSSPLTSVQSNRSGFEWDGKDPDLATDFATIWVTHEFGKTVNWEVKKGRDFSRDFATDTNAMIINQAAVKYMNIDEPVGKTVHFNDKQYQIVGVIQDVIMDSPYEAAKQTVYCIDYENVNWINLKLNPERGTHASMQDIESVFKSVIPDAPFEYKFVDDEYEAKFREEVRIGKLASVFSGLAIVISCLGVFGLASFVAEKRAKEIGIRKIIGASLYQLWGLLSKEFVFLVILSCFIAMPIAYYILHDWLQKYSYRASIPWWVFAVSAIGSLLLTIIIVSFQTMKAARANPVDSLRDE